MQVMTFQIEPTSASARNNRPPGRGATPPAEEPFAQTLTRTRERSQGKADTDAAVTSDRDPAPATKPTSDDVGGKRSSDSLSDRPNEAPRESADADEGTTESTPAPSAPEVSTPVEELSDEVLDVAVVAEPLATVAVGGEAFASEAAPSMNKSPAPTGGEAGEAQPGPKLAGPSNQATSVTAEAQILQPQMSTQPAPNLSQQQPASPARVAPSPAPTVDAAPSVPTDAGPPVQAESPPSGSGGGGASAGGDGEQQPSQPMTSRPPQPAAATATPTPAFDAPAPAAMTAPANAGPQPVLGDTAAAPSPSPSADAPASPSTGDEAAPARLNAARVARGLQNAVQQGGGAVTLRLTPAELGTVRVQMELRGTTVAAQLQTETEAARHVLSQTLSQLRSALEGQGLQVDRLQVQVMQPGGQAPSGNQQQDFTGQDGRSRGFAGHDQRGDTPSQRDPEGRPRREAFERMLLNQVA